MHQSRPKTLSARLVPAFAGSLGVAILLSVSPVPAQGQYYPQQQQAAYPAQQGYAPGAAQSAPQGYGQAAAQGYSAPGGGYAPNGYAPQAQYQPPTPMPGMPVNGMNQPMAAKAQGAGAPVRLSVKDWFAQYDQIRRRAQMTPVEKQRADGLMSKGLSILVPGEEKAAGKQLLQSLVYKYQRAIAEIQQLPMLPETQNLQRGYYQYFLTAGNLFSDYMRVQDNVFIADANGQPIAAGLLPRKQALEQLEFNIKQLDGQLRQQFGVPPYQY